MVGKRAFHNLFADSKGNILVLAGIAMPVLIGFAGLATDTIRWTLDERQLQRTADSAALAGAFALQQSRDPEASAMGDIEETNQLVLYAAPLIENAPTAGAYVGDPTAVRVVLRTQRSLPFSGLFLDSAPIIEVVGTAAVVKDGEFCIIALDQGTNSGVTSWGSASLDLNCGIFANSRGPNGVSAGGASTLNASPVGSVGGVASSSSYSAGTVLMPFSSPQADPFANLPTPQVSGCSPKVNVQPNATRTLSPGCYRGMDLKGSATLQPGVYYIDGGSLSFGSGANVSGTGVTFVLTSATAASNPNSIAGLDMTGSPTINLSAPTSGPYEGVLFYQDRRAPIGITNKFRGGGASSLDGSFYFPRQHMDFRGNNGLTTNCLQIVSYTIEFSGNSSINNDCSTSGAEAFAGTTVRLVE